MQRFNILMNCKIKQDVEQLQLVGQKSCLLASQKLLHVLIVLVQCFCMVCTPWGGNGKQCELTT